VDGNNPPESRGRKHQKPTAITMGGRVRLIGYLAMWARDRLLMTHNTENFESQSLQTGRHFDSTRKWHRLLDILGYYIFRCNCRVEESSENVRITEMEALPRKWNSQVNCRRSSSSRKSSLGCADRLCASAAFTYARVYLEIKALSRMISREEKVGAEDPSAFRPVVSHAVGLARALATAPS
jgi:hypothetical protein